MKNTLKISSILLVSLMFPFVGCELEEDDSIDIFNVETLTDIAGEYECSGECITTVDGSKVVATVKSETDKIERYPTAKENLYEVNITSGTFKETELGALCGRTLRTATSQVSDSTYPVLEEYVFETDDNGEVVGFTKTVRNPNHDNFKTCVIYGKKVKK